MKQENEKKEDYLNCRRGDGWECLCPVNVCGQRWEHENTPESFTIWEHECYRRLKHESYKPTN